MKQILTAFTLSILALCGATSCADRTPSTQEHENAVYHWKRSVNLSDADKAFLKEHDITRIYLRYFDIREDYTHGAVPGAAAWLSAGDVSSDVAVVPTVFITLEAMKAMSEREGEFALKICDYIKSMSEAAEISNIPEVQLDCDWTESTQDSYFRLCEEVGKRLAEDNIRLSSTIRLHQLSLPAPPVDKGVLMVYNVGNLKSPEETNSILRPDEVEKYLADAPRYALPLDVAYPVFSWGAVFRDGTFDRLTRIDTPVDSIKGLRHIKGNWYELTGSNSDDGLSLAYHEQMRYESPSFKDIMASKKMVEKYLGYKPEYTILYHLDENQMAKYTPNQISDIYE